MWARAKYQLSAIDRSLITTHSQREGSMQVSPTNLSPIANPGSSQAGRSQQTNSPEEAAETAAQKTAESAGLGDTVKLSRYAQAKLLKKQGYSIAQIANTLRLDVKTVNGYFNGPGSPQVYSPSPSGSKMPQTAPSSTTK